MTNPFEILGLPVTADDGAIRQRYLELIRTHTPEHQPAKFAAIRAAYEQVKDLNTRLTKRLFEAGKKDNLTALVEEMECQIPRERISLEKLLSLLRK